MRTADRIHEKLTAALAPSRLDIVDESGQHVGHVGARAEGETHFRLTIVTEAFVSKTRVERQRLVYQILAAELAGGVHALALKTLAPDEAGAADL